MKKFSIYLISVAIICAFNPNVQAKKLPADVISTYAIIANAVYEDSLFEAIKLRKEIRKLISKPSQEQLNRARQAWIAARVPYSQSEVFRFGNPIVDEWEGNVNAWPLDEGLIDYIVDSPTSADNIFSTANVIANITISSGDGPVNALKIDQELLKVLHSLGDIETNVATGYHAIEFLLWGQDLNGTSRGAGNRLYTDFDRKNCTNGNCFRRGAYLKVLADLLVKELTWITKQWEPQTDEKYSYVNGNDFDVFDVGTARQAILDIRNQRAWAAMLIGMGSLAYGELAGERTKLALILNDPEEEQDCFSDNTHNSHFYNLLGIKNVFYGEYRRIDGSIVKGVGIADVLKKADKSVFTEVSYAFDSSLLRAKELVDSAQVKGIYFDQLIAKSNNDGEKLLNGFIESLLQLTQSFNSLAASLGIKGVVFEGSDAFKNNEDDEFFK